MAKKPDQLRKLAAHLKARGTGRGRHSELYRWMFTNAEGLQAVLTEAQPSWESIAEALAAQSINDGNGKPPTAERARKVWFKVRTAKGWTGAKPTPPAATQAPQPEAVPTPRAVPDRAAPEFDEPPPRTFGTSRLRGHVPSTPAPAPATPTETKPDADRAARVIAALMKNQTRNPFRTDEDGD